MTAGAGTGLPPAVGEVRWLTLGGLSGPVRLVHLLFLLPFTARVRGSLSLPVPDVALVVGEPGALKCTGGCAGPAYSGVRCQGGFWLGVRQLVVVSWFLFLLVM